MFANKKRQCPVLTFLKNKYLWPISYDLHLNKSKQALGRKASDTVEKLENTGKLTKALLVGFVDSKKNTFMTIKGACIRLIF